MKKYLIITLLPLLFFFLTNCTKTKKPSAFVSFTNLKDGVKVPQTFLVKFGVEGMKVVPAGQALDDKTCGHHHIIVDSPKGYIDEGVVVHADEKHIHFGKGQTETKLTLSPGKHKLSLQFADGAHKSYGKSLATSIHVEVQ